MPPYIYPFSDISVADVPLVGGKGANLGELTRAGLPVPPGFCLAAQAYRDFVGAAVQTEIASLLAATDLSSPDAVEDSSAQVRALLLSTPVPAAIETALRDAYAELARSLGAPGDLPVAVRSSATAEDLPDASFAGQQDTYLNIRGEADLLAHVKQCWASLWTARAVTYRERQNYAHARVALAVVVQAMIESELSGILFTANPVNSHQGEMVLNASWGLGEAIVSGLVTPDTWIVRKADRVILESDVAAKDLAVEYAPTGGTREVVVPPERRDIVSLDDASVRVLVELGERVEAHYARPMDIEWAFARGRFYMLQARPITTLSGDTPPGPSASLSASASPAASSGPPPDTTPFPSPARDGEYNRTMFVEIFPDPLSPSFLSVVAPLFGSMLAFTFRTLGFTPPVGIPAIGVYYNQPYFHREYIEAAFAPLSPPVRAALVTQIVNPFGRHETRLPVEASPAFVGMVARLTRFMTRFPRRLPGLIASYRREIDHLSNLPLPVLSDAEIVARVRDLVLGPAAQLLNYDFLMIALIGITYQMLGSLLDRYFGSESEQVRARLISGVTGNVTMETNKQLWNLAEEARASSAVRHILETAPDPALRAELAATGDGRIFLARLDAFLERYGHREVRMDILYPTWSQDPAPVFQFLRGYLDVDPAASPQRQQARLVREREQLAREVDARLAGDLGGRLAVSPIFHWVLANSQAHTRERDTMHFELTRLFPPIRGALLTVGARLQAGGVLAQPDDIFFLTLDEMLSLCETPPALRPGWQERVAARRAEMERNALHAPPPYLRDGIPVFAEAGAASDLPGRLRGIAGSPGLATGRVRVIRTPADFDKLQRGEILVAPLTNPVWTPLFAIAGGIVTQVGGILSHGAIVAREYGIPAVMAVPDATTLLHDGQQVTVNGTEGVVLFAL